MKMGGALVCDVSGLPDTIAPLNCGAQFMPIEAGRYGDACLPPIEAGNGLNQQCPPDPADAVSDSIPATAAN